MGTQGCPKWEPSEDHATTLQRGQALFARRGCSRRQCPSLERCFATPAIDKTPLCSHHPLFSFHAPRLPGLAFKPSLRHFSCSCCFFEYTCSGLLYNAIWRKAQLCKKLSSSEFVSRDPKSNKDTVNGEEVKKELQDAVTAVLWRSGISGLID